MKYDVLYQEWLQAKRAKNYKLADQIREDFERLYGLTIFAEGEMVIEGVTVQRILASKWHKKYGNPVVGKIIATIDSKIKQLFPDYRGSSDLGYHY